MLEKLVLSEYYTDVSNDPILGLDTVKEYQNGAGLRPYYHCELQGCYNEQGNSAQMYRHLISYSHKQAWIRARTGRTLELKSEVDAHLAVLDRADLCPAYKSVQDDEAWALCKRARLRAKLPAGAPRHRRRRERERTAEQTATLKGTTTGPSPVAPSHSPAGSVDMPGPVPRLDQLTVGEPALVQPDVAALGMSNSADCNMRRGRGTEHGPATPTTTSTVGSLEAGPTALMRTAAAASETEGVSTSPGRPTGGGSSAAPHPGGDCPARAAASLGATCQEEISQRSSRESVEQEDPDLGRPNGASTDTATTAQCGTGSDQPGPPAEGPPVTTAAAAEPSADDVVVGALAKSVNVESGIVRPTTSPPGAERHTGRQQRGPDVVQTSPQLPGSKDAAAAAETTSAVRSENPAKERSGGGESGRRVVSLQDYLLQRRSRPDVEKDEVRKPDHRNRSGAGCEDPAGASPPGGVTTATTAATACKMEPKTEAKDLPVDLLRSGYEEEEGVVEAPVLTVDQLKMEFNARVTRFVNDILYPFYKNDKPEKIKIKHGKDEFERLNKGFSRCLRAMIQDTVGQQLGLATPEELPVEELTKVNVKEFPIESEIEKHFASLAGCCHCCLCYQQLATF